MLWHHKTDNTNLWKRVPVGCIRYRYLSSCTVSRLELVQLLSIWFIEHIGINVYSKRRLSNFLNYSVKGHQILFALYLPTTTYVHIYLPTFFFLGKSNLLLSLSLGISLSVSIPLPLSRSFSLSSHTSLTSASTPAWNSHSIFYLCTYKFTFFPSFSDTFLQYFIR